MGRGYENARIYGRDRSRPVPTNTFSSVGAFPRSSVGIAGITGKEGSDMSLAISGAMGLQWLVQTSAGSESLGAHLFRAGPRKATGRMSYSKVVELSEGKAYVLHNTFPLDGRISAYPISARGHSVSNCYLLKEDEGALLLDTGYAVHEAEILAQLASILDPETPLSLLPLRINEFMSDGQRHGGR